MQRPWEPFMRFAEWLREIEESSETRKELEAERDWEEQVARDLRLERRREEWKKQMEELRLEREREERERLAMEREDGR